MASPVRVIVVGAGSRGENYSNYASIHPKRMKVVAVADPRTFACTKLQKQHNIEDKNIFKDWQSIAEREKFADAVLICTPDRLHKDPAVAFAKKGYHILLEKPMATTAEDCVAIVEACTQNGVMLSVGHVLRRKRCEERLTFASRPFGTGQNELCTRESRLEEERAQKQTGNSQRPAVGKLETPSISSTKQELSCNGHEITVFDFLTQRSTKHTASSDAPTHFGLSGHGGADYHLINAFISAVANNNLSMIRSGPEETLASHLLVFEAERSRLESRVVYCGDDAQS
uniref:Gfo/Idh/MocA-like oxidoreductase N-terminal domain-containing protein n=1 Tax=Nothobranchius korthausae TaxID=1143690 RepID=A0A1A8FSY5_9TELE